MQIVTNLLEQSTIEGLLLRLPDRQLERKEYELVKKYLNGIGGSWKGGKTQGFVFKNDPRPHIEKLLGTGQVVNLKKDFQFFPTPDELADKMVYLAGLVKGESILEPSAGDGALIRAVHRRHPSFQVDYCELMEENRQLLQFLSGEPYPEDELPNIRLVGEDFLNYENPQGYNCIIANPPFAKKQDIAHVLHMYDLLKPDGRLVTIMSPSWQFNEDKTSETFREFVESTNSEVYEIPSGTFKESGTEIATVLLTIWK